MQSKRGDLEKAFKKFKINRKNYICAKKGDFSLLRNSDLIISIGWQSTALKAASLFEKPLIFYSQYEYPYQGYIFSNNKIKSDTINNLSNDLWLSEKDLKIKFNNLLLDKEKFEKVKNLSRNLLKNLCFYEENIEYYFNEYFK